MSTPNFSDTPLQEVDVKTLENPRGQSRVKRMKASDRADRFAWGMYFGLGFHTVAAIFHMVGWLFQKILS